MKRFLLTLCFLAAATAAVVPSNVRRHARDVTELTVEPVDAYLPPLVPHSSLDDLTAHEQQTTAPEASPTLAEAEAEVDATNSDSDSDTDTIVVAEEDAALVEPQESAALGAKGYEYKTVRRLRFRNRSRRDVSHLNLEYLPPVPSRDYLPPVLDPVDHEELAHDSEEAEVLPKLSNEYLPPAPIVLEAVTEAPVVETTEAPQATTTEAPVTEVTRTAEAEPEETAVLAADGYHYRKPAVVPDLFSVIESESESESEPEPEPQPEQELLSEPLAKLVAEPEREPEVAEPESEPVPVPVIGEYLPPLEEGVIVAEGPGEETSILADDGYHYRAIKRVRF